MDFSSSTISRGGSVLFYTGRWDNFQTYIARRLSYSWSSSSSDGPGDFETTQNAQGLSGSFGGQYALGTRFAVFAEAGLGFSSQTSEAPPSINNSGRTSWTFGTTTAIGATLYSWNGPPPVGARERNGATRQAGSECSELSEAAACQPKR